VGVESREKEDIENPEIRYDPELAKKRLEKAHAKVEDLRRQLDDLKQQSQMQEMLNEMLAKGFMEFYYHKGLTKEQKRGIIQHLVRRIGVGPQELTISWLFMKDGKRRIPRSLTDPRGGKGNP
jgi:predicted RNase H-like nuclease (RuvC/YqgF family)